MRSNREYYRTAYEGGEAFWYGLEQELGEEMVIKVLRSYLAEYKFKIACSRDLLAIIEKEAHKDMDYYFDKWF
jgi:aminopeptidase N